MTLGMTGRAVARTVARRLDEGEGGQRHMTERGHLRGSNSDTMTGIVETALSNRQNHGLTGSCLVVARAQIS